MSDFKAKQKAAEALPLWDEGRRRELEQLGAALGKTRYLMEVWLVFKKAWARDEFAWQASLAQKDIKSLRELAHRFKGSSGSVGTSRLFEVFALIQSQVDSEAEQVFNSPVFLELCQQVGELIKESELGI